MRDLIICDPIACPFGVVLTHALKVCWDVLWRHQYHQGLTKVPEQQ